MANTDILGHRIGFLGGLLSVAPDWYVWLWAYVLTTGSAASVVYLSEDMWNRTYKAVAYGLIFFNQVSSYVLLFSDPGIYPRDPQRDDAQPPPPPEVKGASKAVTSVAAEGLQRQAYCHPCRLYRPPRTSHCYVCGVCICEHDHHCVLLGVCIGKRSLRWFVLYLLTTMFQLYAGMFFLIVSFRRTPYEEDWKQRPPPDGAVVWTHEAIEAFQNSITFTTLFHLVVMGIIAILMLPITAGTVAYVLLPLTNTTWREAQHDGIRLHKPKEGRRHCWFVQLFVNVNKMLCAGPSLLSRREKKR